jgi:hypothetical protein
VGGYHFLAAATNSLSTSPCSCHASVYHISTDGTLPLQVPDVSLSPPLEEIQEAINGTAKKVLSTSRQLTCWGIQDGPASYHDLIAQDKEIVKSVLLLTGAVEGIKLQVDEYLSTFSKYGFLWKEDLQKAYESFMKVRLLLCMQDSTVALACLHGSMDSMGSNA